MNNHPITAAQAIDRAREENRAALIGYLTAGFPSVERSIEAARTLIEAGVDIIELGLPYSDPGMDGPIIQHSGQASLDAGFRTDDIFTIGKAISGRGAAVVIMSYYNPVLARGIDRFASEMADAGISGLITPDLPPEEAGQWIEAADKHNLERIFLAAPSSSEQRLATIADSSRGFVYAAARMGVTGLRAALDEHATDLITRVRTAGAERVCMGIGVSNRAQAHDVARLADGVIVGSALISAIADEDTPWRERLDNLATLTRELRQGVARS